MWGLGARATAPLSNRLPPLPLHVRRRRAENQKKQKLTGDAYYGSSDEPPRVKKDAAENACLRKQDPKAREACLNEANPPYERGGVYSAESKNDPNNPPFEVSPWRVGSAGTALAPRHSGRRVRRGRW